LIGTLRSTGLEILVANVECLMKESAATTACR